MVAAEPAAAQDRPRNRKPRRLGEQSPAPAPTAQRRSPAGHNRRRHPARVPLAAARSGPARRSPFAVAQHRTLRGPSGFADAPRSTPPRLTWPRCFPGPGSPAARAAEGTQARSGVSAKAPAPGHTWTPALVAGGSPGSRNMNAEAKKKKQPNETTGNPDTEQLSELNRGEVSAHPWFFILGSLEERVEEKFLMLAL